MFNRLVSLRAHRDARFPRILVSLLLRVEAQGAWTGPDGRNRSIAFEDTCDDFVDSVINWAAAPPLAHAVRLAARHRDDGDDGLAADLSRFVGGVFRDAPQSDLMIAPGPWVEEVWPRSFSASTTRALAQVGHRWAPAPPAEARTAPTRQQGVDRIGPGTCTSLALPARPRRHLRINGLQKRSTDEVVRKAS